MNAWTSKGDNWLDSTWSVDASERARLSDTRRESSCSCAVSSSIPVTLVLISLMRLAAGLEAAGELERGRTNCASARISPLRSTRSGNARRSKPMRSGGAGPPLGETGLPWMSSVLRRGSCVVDDVSASNGRMKRDSGRNPCLSSERIDVKRQDLVVLQRSQWSRARLRRLGSIAVHAPRQQVLQVHSAPASHLMLYDEAVRCRSGQRHSQHDRDTELT